jgi:hypothetical protein
MLDWLENLELRRRCQVGLNKGEQRHALAQAICTFKQGRIADYGTEVQQYRASGLNLLIAAIVYWNSTYMAEAVTHLRASGASISDDLLVHTSPVGWEHIALSGDFLWDRGGGCVRGKATAEPGPIPASRMMAVPGTFDLSVVYRTTGALPSNCFNQLIPCRHTYPPHVCSCGCQPLGNMSTEATTNPGEHF